MGSVTLSELGEILSDEEITKHIEALFPFICPECGERMTMQWKRNANGDVVYRGQCKRHFAVRSPWAIGLVE